MQEMVTVLIILVLIILINRTVPIFYIFSSLHR